MNCYSEFLIYVRRTISMCIVLQRIVLESILTPWNYLAANSGHWFEKINGAFTHDNYYYKFYFIWDSLHKLKLACSSLGELGIFLAREVKKIEFITLLHKEQMQSGLQFSVYIFCKRIQHFPNKMNIKVASSIQIGKIRTFFSL